MTEYISSEGEELMEEFFDEKNIDYEREKKILKLKEDYADYRVADFYLPKYRVYVEFLGKWNSEEGKAKYKKKMEVYRKNNIPCVYIFPDNLGTLEFTFFRRLREVLQEDKKLKLQWIRLNIKQIWENYALIFGVIILFFIYRKELVGRIFLSIIFIVIFAHALMKTFFRKIESKIKH